VVELDVREESLIEELENVATLDVEVGSAGR
jgi:hypothetical protein